MALGALKARTPWQAKIAAKIIFSRLPISYDIWRRIGLFQHGDMERPDYAIASFSTQLTRAGGASLEGAAVLELGPGDSLASALLAKAHGASAVYLVDVGDFANKDLKLYRQLAWRLSESGLDMRSIQDVGSVDEMLAVCGAKYLTNGVESLAEIRDAGIDFQFSTAVLEHIRKADFQPLLKELRRVTSDDGVAAHTIDLQDHLAYALNNLRFSERVWESDFFARSQFYTNRIRYKEMLAMFERAGFEINVVSQTKFDELPTPREKMDSAFRGLSAEDLIVAGFDVVLRPRHDFPSKAR
jgi:SAM-dependent methyltransferase